MPSTAKQLTQLALLLVLIVGLTFLWAYYPSIDRLSSLLPNHIVGRRGSGVPPIYAFWRAHWAPDAAFHLTLACATVAVTTVIARLASTRLSSTPVFLLLIVACVAVVNVMVARVDRGHDSLVQPFTRTKLEYFGDIPKVEDDPVAFIRNYHTLSPKLSLHAGTHPPGGVVLLYLNSKLLGPSVDAAAYCAIAFGALSVLPAWMFVRHWLGRSVARRAMPLYVVTPSLVIFGATSMDAVFHFFTLLALATTVLALRSRSPVNTQVNALFAGFCLFLATFFTFAAIVVPAFVLARLIVQLLLRRNSVVREFLNSVLIAGAFLVSCGIAILLGYDIPKVVQAAIERDHLAMGDTGISSPALYVQWSLGNVLAFLFASGIALTAVLACGLILKPADSRHRAACWTLLLTLVLLGYSTLFSLETERVWLPLAVPLVACASAGLGSKTRGFVLVLCAIQTLLMQWYWFTWW